MCCTALPQKSDFIVWREILIFLLCVFNGDKDYDLIISWCFSTQRTSAFSRNPPQHFNSVQGWVSLLLKCGHFAVNPAMMQSITKHSSRTESIACLMQLETAAGRQEMGKVAMKKSIFCCPKDPGSLSHEAIQLCK